MDLSKIRLEGAQRACPPGETLARMAPFMDAAGITRISEITGLDRIGIPVAQSVRPDALILSVDSGKGATAEAARCSALMESFERWAGESADVPVLRATIQHLGDTCETRLPLLRGAMLHPMALQQWAKAVGIESCEEKFVPLCAVKLLPRRAPTPLASHMFAGNSNGLSSGNTRDEAICGGLYEVIERDATHLNQIARSRGHKTPRVDLDSIKDPTLETLVEQLRSADVFPILFDCTSGIGVPVYMAYLYDTAERGNGLFKGYAAHLDPAVAQTRAICEAAQGRLVWISGSRDDLLHERFTRPREEDLRPQLLEDLIAGHPLTESDRYPDESCETFTDDIETLVGKFEAAGLPEPLVVDLPVAAPCSVVRVIGPMLEGYFSAGVASGPRAKAILEALM